MFIVSVPAGVFGELVSAKNRPARRTSIPARTTVFAHADIPLPDLPIQHIIAQELSATVVTDWE